MIQLNLPIYEAKIKKEVNNVFSIYDDLRCKFVRLTSEEWVRQCFIHYLIDTYEYPRGLMMNEVQINIGGIKRRVDTIVYNKQHKPTVLIEYKSPKVKLSQKVIDQILLYDIAFQVEYLIVTNGLKHLAWKINTISNSWESLSNIPSKHILNK